MTPSTGLGKSSTPWKLQKQRHNHLARLSHVTPKSNGGALIGVAEWRLSEVYTHYLCSLRRE